MLVGNPLGPLRSWLGCVLHVLEKPWRRRRLLTGGPLIMGSAFPTVVEGSFLRTFSRAQQRQTCCSAGLLQTHPNVSLETLCEAQGQQGVLESRRFTWCSQNSAKQAAQGVKATPREGCSTAPRSPTLRLLFSMGQNQRHYHAPPFPRPRSLATPPEPRTPSLHHTTNRHDNT